MKLEDFESILKQHKKNRFNVKLLFVNNYDLVPSIKKIFNKNGFKIKDLREFQQKEDEWFGFSKLAKIIREITQPTVLFSVSEIVRFYSNEDFKAFFNQIFAIENRDFDIYIPVFGLKSRFLNDFYNSYYRKDEYEFFYEIDSEYKNILLYVVDFDISYPNRLDTVRDWLSFYNNPKNNLICLSKPLVKRIKNHIKDDLLKIEYIVNEKEFLEKYLKKSFPIEYKNSEKKLWKRLIKDLENTSLKELIQEKLNINQLKFVDILNKVCHQNNNRYLKWILKGYALKYLDDDNYSTAISKNADINKPFIYEVWFNIFDNFKKNYIQERFNILQEFYKNEKPNQKIELKLKEKLLNTQNTLSFLTGITKVEKELIINFCNKKEISLEQLKRIYPDLYFYLSDVEFKNNIDWVREYFKEYKISKITNKPTKRLSELLKEYNGSKDKFFGWYEDLNFKELYSFNDLSNFKKLWIDGLGIEWVGLIESYIKSKYQYNIECYLSKSKLPTKTECNRFENIKKVETLDKYIHEQKKYQYPLNLIEEIEIIKNIIDENIEDNLLIVSDHGFSPFCSFKNKINDFDNVDHEGRCAKIDDLIEDSNYFSYDFECGRYLVSLNHNSLSNKTRREAHGGVTPEEVIVPIIKIYKTNETFKEDKKEVKKKEIKRGFIEEELF